MSLTAIPSYLSDNLNIPFAAAQTLLSMVVICAVIFPILYFNRERKGFAIEIFVFLLLEGVLVGIGWLNFWFLAATVALMAMTIGYFGSQIVTGG